MASYKAKILNVKILLEQNHFTLKACWRERYFTVASNLIESVRIASCWFKFHHPLQWVLCEVYLCGRSYKKEKVRGMFNILFSCHMSLCTPRRCHHARKNYRELESILFISSFYFSTFEGTQLNEWRYLLNSSSGRCSNSHFVLFNLLNKYIFRFANTMESLIIDHPLNGSLFLNEVFDI